MTIMTDTRQCARRVEEKTEDQTVLEKGQDVREHTGLQKARIS